MNGTESLAVSKIFKTDHVADPEFRNWLLLLDWEGCAPASTGPLPHGVSVYHDAQKCADPANAPIGLAWVKALTSAVVEAHQTLDREGQS